ncbi:hypothetical protein HK101_003481 [Irineochytrium annulatum]|nr:hypothetical protein HK101_003481 [Irineochytrium annulatum]
MLALRRAFLGINKVQARPINLFVGNLSWTVRNEDLGSLFAQYGEVKSARVLTDRETGRSRGFGFVEMSDEGGATAMEKLHGQDFKGRPLRVQESDRRPPPPRDDSRGEGGEMF